MAVEEKKQEGISINTSTFNGSVFSQGAVINVSDHDVTIEFLYFNPQTKIANVVSRVTMPLNVAEKFHENMKLGMEKHKTGK